MGVSKYIENGVEYWRVYVDLRSRKDKRIRVQKRINRLKSEREALSEERKVTREISEQISNLESRGARWSDVIDRWCRHHELYPSKRYAQTTILDHAALLRNWTAPWLDRIASELTRGDGREIDRQAQDAGKSAAFRKKIKVTINVVYNWGLEEQMITGAQQGPTHGLEIRRDREELKPEILTIEQIRNLLHLAKEQNHDWYPIWLGAVMTGCRSGELHEIKREDVDLLSSSFGHLEDQKPQAQRRYGNIRVRKSWSVRFKKAGPTKAGYWRTVPISGEFYWFLINELRIESLKPGDHLFPQSWKWDQGLQASILRGFCEAHGIPSIRFHTLRACFATQLITSGVSPTVVMKICGWNDIKTMQRYIRMAGVDEAGATENLRFISTPTESMEVASRLYGTGPEGHRAAEVGAIDQINDLVSNEKLDN